MHSSKESQRWPWYVIILAALFPLFLYVHNLGQVSLTDLWRPVIFSALASLLIFGLTYLILREKRKAGLITALIEIFVFSYGHVYNLLKPVTISGELVGRHRYLAPVLVLFVGVLIWVILVKIKESENLEKLVRTLVLILFAVQVVQIAYYEISSGIAQNQARREVETVSQQAGMTAQRDVYLIVLDSYMRSDWLEEEFGYDNSAFIEKLEEMGFYIASCSRSNYAHTIQSMTSELNLDYLDELDIPMEDTNLSAQLKHSVVREFFTDLGYEFVFYESGYPWIEMEDADRFVPAQSNVYLKDFEFLYLKTTIIAFPYDVHYKIVSDSADASMQRYADRVKSAFVNLQNPVKSETPVFVYAHIVSPHSPRIFTRTGQINPDWELNVSESNMETYAYVEGQTILAIKNIIANSSKEPIIILQADHGDGDNSYRTLILNAYYLPEGGEKDLYPTISPVNTFRVIFNRYFNQSYPLLEDKSYFSPEKSRYDFQLVEDPYDDCRDLGVK